VGELAATTYNRNAGRAIERARDELNLSQKEFGKKLTKMLGISVSQGAVSGWERADRHTPAAALIAAADLCGSTVDKLLGRTDPAVSQLVREFLERVATQGTSNRKLNAPTKRQPTARTRRIRSVVDR
jgi:transcriptional regulator with XRE-family HTH domain